VLSDHNPSSGLALEHHFQTQKEKRASRKPSRSKEECQNRV
jgi:hypothetical protein